MIISGCNSDKKLVEWLRAQSAGLRKSVRVSGCHKKKQEVDFDLLCRLVPPTDKSCNLLGDSFHKKGTLQVDDMFVIYKSRTA